MKILFFIDSYGPGGKERRLTELMKFLHEHRQVDFELAVMHDTIHYREVLELGIRVHYLIRSVKKDVFVFRKLYKICKSCKADIIHCWDSMTAVYAVPVAKLLNIKLVNGMITDAPGPRNNSMKLGVRRGRLVFPFSTLIIGNSQAGLLSYQAPAEKSICIHNGFNFSRIAHLEKTSLSRASLQIGQSLVVGMVASYSDMKDYPTYFEAAQQILAHRKDVVFMAIGKHTDSREAKSHIQPGFEPYFRLLGTRNDTESLIHLMDVCVLSTFTEGISNAILEYMAMEKPVVATDGGGTNEIIEDEVTGYLVPPSSPGALAQKIEALLDDGALRCRMGQAGKKRIETEFSIGKMAGQYLQAYENLQ